MGKPKYDFPIFQRLEIETQSNCNRDCWFCPRTHDRSGDYLDESGRAVINRMPTDKVLDLLDQAQALGFRGLVGFYFYSESLLDKRNIMFAQEARERQMRPRLHTNGDAIQKNDALLSEVVKAYDEIVMGLYDYLSNEELEQTKRFWTERLSGTTVKFSSIGPEGARSAHSMAIPRALLPTDSRVAIPDLTFTNAPCRRPLIRMIIRHDGEMCNCCEDLHGEFSLGNVYEHSLESLWYSKHHAEIISNLASGRRDLYTLCANCPASPSGPAPDGKRVSIARRRYKPSSASSNAAPALKAP